jgi:hypothetical protein
MQFRHDDFWQEMAESFNTLMERQKEAERVVRESRFAIAANSEAESSVSQSNTDDDCRQPTVRSADEALRLLDSASV